MASKAALQVFLGSLDAKSYYEVLRVARDATPAAVQVAFHDFARLYHPDQHADAEREVAGLASEIYKRGVEAYGCLSRSEARGRYDRALARGKLRIDRTRPSTPPPPPPPVRTLDMLARSAAGRQHAVRADRLISAGKLDEARVQLVSACQCEPANEELAERLQLLYEALSLEPP